MKRPAFQWYPGDFQRDTALQSCSWEARSLWREMLDRMHDGEPYGHLTAGGVTLNAEDMSRFVGKPAKLVEQWFAELERKKVFSRTPLGVVFSRRMVRDEAVRTQRASYGKLGGNPALIGAKDKREDNQNPENDDGKVNPPLKVVPTPATATAVATAKELQLPVVVSAAELNSIGILLCVAANLGLAEHPTRPQALPRVLPTSSRTLEATEAILAAGVPAEYAEQQIREMASSHTADGTITSLKYFTDGVVRAWQVHQAGEHPAANGGRRRRPRGTPQQFEYPPATTEEVAWRK